MIGGIVGGVLGLLCVIGAIAAAFVIGKRRGAASQHEQSAGDSFRTVPLRPQSSPAQSEYDTIQLHPQLTGQSTYDTGHIEKF